MIFSFFLQAGAFFPFSLYSECFHSDCVSMPVPWISVLHAVVDDVHIQHESPCSDSRQHRGCGVHPVPVPHCVCMALRGTHQEAGCRMTINSSHPHDQSAFGLLLDSVAFMVLRQVYLCKSASSEETRLWTCLAWTYGVLLRVCTRQAHGLLGVCQLFSLAGAGVCRGSRAWHPPGGNNNNNNNS